MSDPVYSRGEIKAITRTPIQVRQIAFLQRNGIRHYVDGYGWPVVLRSSLEMGDTAAPAVKAWKSNKGR